MAPIVLTEAFGDHPPSASLRDIRASTEVARLAGCRIYALRPEAGAGEGEDPLAEVPPQAAETAGVWIGYIPSPERARPRASSYGTHCRTFPPGRLGVRVFAGIWQSSFLPLLQ